MHYRKFNGQGWQASVLGFGTAELPADDDEAREILKSAVEGGINYIDCRYNEPDEEERACRTVGSVIDDTIRVCVNFPVRDDISTLDISVFLRERAGWLKRERINFLTLDNLNRDTWPAVKESGLLGQAEQVLKDGKIEALGFSFRDQFLYLRQVIAGSGVWSFGKFEYSFMDDDHLPGTSGLNFSAQQGLAVIATEPLKRGRLAGNIPADIAELWRDGNIDSPAAMALTWVWSHPQVTTAVVDVNSREELEEYLALSERAGERSISIQEEILLGRVRDAYRKRRPLPCTTCRVCMPCHAGVDAPRIFELYNDAVMYDNCDIPRRLYRLEGHDITGCNDCGACARACGRSIDIPERLREAASILGGH